MTGKLSNDLQARFLDLEENYKRISFEIGEAAVRSGRRPEEVQLLAATKTVPVEVINHGLSLGIRHIGENRVQELCDKYSGYAPADVQFIGRLQTNKVKYLMDKVSVIQSVDSFRLASEISRLCKRDRVSMNILIEVNIGKEKQKSGVMPEELEEFLLQAASLEGIRVKGLMAIPPAEASPAETRSFFSKMAQYFVDIKSKSIDNVTMDCLSMGMSSDFTDAILCGSTMVRVGSSLFGARLSV